MDPAAARPKISAVIAAWNEEECIEPLTRRLHAVLVSLAGAWEMIFVVEGDDATRSILEKLKRELGGDLRILYETEPQGLGAACRRGFAAVAPDADLVVTMDADLNHQPEEIPHLVDALESAGADIAIGSRAVAGSRVTGTPAWKRALSWTLNLVMRALFGVDAIDKTSGFRVYRADSLRRIRFENDNFAFLPEMLIVARSAGMKVVEVPIHFIFRRDGVSKMRLLPTSLSYLSLLRTRFDRWSALALLLIAGGTLLRVAANFPVHKSPIDADVLLTGVCACMILDGDAKVFLADTRVGAVECYAGAALFRLFGVSRFTLGLVSPLMALLMLGACWSFFRRIFERPVAVAALALIAFPMPVAHFWSSLPAHYPTLMFLCAAILAAAARNADLPQPRFDGAVFGAAVGMGLWLSLLSLAVSAPAALWLAWRNRPLLRDRRWLALTAAGFAAGAAPLLAYNVRYPFGSFTRNFAVRSLGIPLDPWANLRVTVETKLPDLLVWFDAERRVVATPFRTAGVIVVAVLFCSAAILALRDALRRGSDRSKEDRRRRAGWFLLAGVALLTVAVNTFSQAGSLHGMNTRYVLPAYFFFAASLGWMLVAMAKRSRVAAAAMAALVLSYNFSAYSLPGQTHRNELELQAALDDQVAAELERRGIELVIGNYWTAWPFAFLTRERVAAIGCGYDYYDVARTLPARPVKWAAIARPEERYRSLEQAIRGEGISGTWRFTGGYWLFEPNEPASVARALEVCEIAKTISPF